MPSSLSFTTEVTSNNKLEITCKVNPGGTLPEDIFIYRNTGTTSLGDYYGVCNLEEYQRLQTFTGTAIPNFGNKFVKSKEAKVTIGVHDDPRQIIDHITNVATFLSFAMSNSTSVTQIINIP
jgi:hypothetical protein